MLQHSLYGKRWASLQHSYWGDFRGGDPGEPSKGHLMLRLLPLDPGLSISSDSLRAARKCRFLSVISHILNVSIFFKLILKTMFVKQNSLCAYSDLQATILPTWSNRIPRSLSRVNTLQDMLRTAENLCFYPSLPDLHWDDLVNPRAEPQLHYHLSPVMPDLIPSLELSGELLGL